MPSHIEEALALVALELAAQAFTTVAFIVVQPYAVEWRWASVLLPLVQLLQEHITRHAPDTIPTHRATRALATGIERSATATPIRRCRCRLPRRQQRAGRRRRTAWKLSFTTRHERWLDGATLGSGRAPSVSAARREREAISRIRTVANESSWLNALRGRQAQLPPAAQVAISPAKAIGWATDYFPRAWWTIFKLA